MLYGFVPQVSDEKKIVEKITSFNHQRNAQPDLTLFYNLLFDPVRQEGIDDYTGFFLAINVDRQEFELSRIGRPGDFDIMFIPFAEEHVYFDRTAVYEVKIARPSFERQNKGTKSLGETQVYGLIEDGFPLIGLIHVVIPTPLLLQQTVQIKISKNPINIDWQPGDPPQAGFDNLFEYQPVDWLPWHSISKQMSRMISTGFPKYIGINAFAVMQKPDGKHSITTSREYGGFTSGYFNPKMSQHTINCISAHFEKYGTSRYRTINR